MLDHHDFASSPSPLPAALPKSEPNGEHRVKVGPALTFVGDHLDRLSDLFKLLSDKTRLKILDHLEDGERNVTNLCALLALPQPTVSHHLALLRHGGLIKPRKAGKQVYYRLNSSVGYAALARDGEGGVDLDGSTQKVGRHPDGFQIAWPGVVVQIITGGGTAGAPATTG